MTSGATRAPLDAIRYISPKGTGQLGALFAEEAMFRGADITFVYGRSSALPAMRGIVPNQLSLVAVETVGDLIAAFRQELPRHYDAVIHPMAVLDFEPAEPRPGKVSSDAEEWIMRLVPTPKAITLVKELSPETFLVGFKLEVDKEHAELHAIAHDFLTRTRCDLVVANDLRDIEAGRHTGHFIVPGGEVVQVAVGKEAIAWALCDYLDQHLR